MAFVANFWGSPRGLPRSSNQHYTFSVVGGEEDNAGGFEGTADLVARILANLESLGLPALQRGQGPPGSCRRVCLYSRSARAARTWREVIIHRHLQCRRGIIHENDYNDRLGLAPLENAADKAAHPFLALPQALPTDQLIT